MKILPTLELALNVNEVVMTIVNKSKADYILCIYGKQCVSYSFHILSINTVIMNVWEVGRQGESVG